MDPRLDFRTSFPKSSSRMKVSLLHTTVLLGVLAPCKAIQKGTFHTSGSWSGRSALI